MKLQILCISFLAIISCDCIALESKIMKINANGDFTFDKGHIFLTAKSSIMTDTDIELDKLKEWEEIVGPIPLKKTINSVRTINITKLKKFGVDEGKQLSYFNFGDKSLKSFVFKKDVIIKLVEGPYYDPAVEDQNWWVPFDTFNILLIDDPKLVGNKVEWDRFDGLASIDPHFQLLPGEIIRGHLNCSSIEQNNKDIETLKKILSADKIADDLQICPLFTQTVYCRKNGPECYFKMNDNNFVSFPRWGADNSARVLGYGSWIRGSKLNLIMESYGRTSLIIIYPEKVESVFLDYDPGYKG